MHAAVLLARAVLALVFLIAGVAKLADLDTSRDTVEAFGFTLPVARVVGTALPFAEITVALGLLVQQSSRWAAVAAIVLLAGFTAAIGRALSRGSRPNCNCFGQLTSQAIGAQTIGRNLVHGSDSPDSAAREIAIWFTDAELFPREHALASMLVSN